MAAMGSITTSLTASPSDFGSQKILALRTLSVFCVHFKRAVLPGAMRRGVPAQDLPRHYAGEIAELFDALAERLEPGEGLGPGPIPLGAACAAGR